nr:MAG TPA: hypothetical protein [Bacteriophage sp.]
MFKGSLFLSTEVIALINNVESFNTYYPLY